MPRPAAAECPEDIARALILLMRAEDLEELDGEEMINRHGLTMGCSGCGADPPGGCGFPPSIGK